MQSFLKRFAKFENGGPIISVYLNTEANENGKRNFPVVLKKGISEAAGQYEVGSEERGAFEAAVAHIEDFAENIQPETRGVAAFAQIGSELFEKFEFDVAMAEDEVLVADRPHLYPLMRLLSQHPPIAAVAADTNSARIFVFQRGKIIEREEIEGTKTNRSEVGGWSQMRYQRHIENFHQQHAKEVIEELDRIVRADRIAHVVIVGNKETIVPLLRDEMSQELAGKIVGTVEMRVDSAEHELMEAVQTAVRQFDTLEDMKKIEALNEENYDGGLGVTGVEKTLAALLNGQVQELYITDDLRGVKYDKRAVAKVLKDYEPGEDGNLPDAGEEIMLVDDLLLRAADSAEVIRFIEDASLLKDAGGVGALLRYQVKGVTS
jgi:peptide chain release factor subunit 1